MQIIPNRSIIEYTNGEYLFINYDTVRYAKYDKSRNETDVVFSDGQKSVFNCNILSGMLEKEKQK